MTIYTTDQILGAIEKKKISALILLDLSKAFDSISHQRLLQKLSAVGASPAAVSWFQSYLIGRTISAHRLHLVRSTTNYTRSSRPQCAILSPLLFCTYLNDLPDAPQFCQFEYVDDSKFLLFFPLTDFNDAKIKLEEDLRKVSTWCCENQLLINPDKTKFMFIGTRQLMSSYSVDFSISFTGRTHTPVDSARDLGVIMNSHLTYGSHISYLVSSCLSKLVQINRVKKSFVKDILMLIVSSLLFSKMFYCSSVWSNTSKNNIKRLQLIQNYACRIITSSQKYDHVTPLLQEQMRLLFFLYSNNK